MTDGDERILNPKSSMVNPFWTDEEIMLLEQNYPKAQISPSDMVMAHCSITKENHTNIGDGCLLGRSHF